MIVILGDYVLAIINTNKARKLFGKLRYSSHPSLKELFEVSGKELDAVVGFCIDYELVIGVKSTRASFGGCAIALLKKGYEEDFAKHLTHSYVAKIGDGFKKLAN